MHSPTVERFQHLTVFDDDDDDDDDDVCVCVRVCVHAQV